MTDFDIEDVTRIARDAAREHSPSITVAGVVLGADGSDYVEILVNLEGCRAHPCQFSLEKRTKVERLLEERPDLVVAAGGEQSTTTARRRPGNHWFS